MKGFRDFLMRGNLIELAVAFIMGTAFAAVVKSFTQLIMDLIGKIGAKPDFSTINIGGVNIGVFLTNVVSFVITATVIYFLIVKPVEAFKNRKGVVVEVSAPTQEELLTEIRDLLAKKN